MTDQSNEAERLRKELAILDRRLAQLRAAMECEHPEGFVCTGTAYGGDDDSYHGEGRSYCPICGADGDG